MNETNQTSTTDISSPLNDNNNTTTNINEGNTIQQTSLSYTMVDAHHPDNDDDTEDDDDNPSLCTDMEKEALSPSSNTAGNDNDDVNAKKQEDNAAKNKTKPSVSRWKQIYTTSDWWTMHIGILCFVLAVAVTYIVVPFINNNDNNNNESTTTPLRVKYIIPQPMKWTSNPFDAWDWYNFAGIPILFVFFHTFYVTSLWFMGKVSSENDKPWHMYSRGFAALFLIATIAYWIGEQSWCKKNGFGYAVWSILFGLILGNSPLFNNNRFHALKTVSNDGEFFIKCSLVLLAVRFAVLGELGLPAVVVAWVESPITLVLSIWIGTKLLGMEMEPTILMATGATWCGASAMAAVASVIDSPKQDVVVCVGIVALFTVVLTFVQPYFAILVGMDERVAGAWIGASIDQTGNVIASAAIISDEATEIAGIVKIVLNSGLGLLVTAVAFWWQAREMRLKRIEEDEHEDVEDGNDGSNEERKKNKKAKFDWLFLWDKFPKFVLGYFICSAILTIIVQEDTMTGTALSIAIKTMSKWWFSIAFCGIGIGTNVVQLWRVAQSTGVIKLYLVANLIDILLSYFFAWLMF